MKKFVKLLNLKENSVASLQEELLKKLREHFDFRMQLKLDQLKNFHILKMVRRSIASIKNCLSVNRDMYKQHVKDKENK